MRRERSFFLLVARYQLFMYSYFLQSIYYMDSRISILRNSVLPLGRRKFKLPAGTLLISRFLFYGKLHPYLFQCRNFEEFDLY
jgi:hypothetical protein